MLSGAETIIECSSEFCPCNRCDTLLLTIKAFSIIDNTFSGSEITI